MNMNVSLTDELGEFVNAKVSSGRYTSASEVGREALRLMERHEQVEAAKLQWLREAYQAGIDSGDAGKLNLAAVKADARNRLSKPTK
ncbi:MAG: type II toxin-antitoxin system ParD family antitoxin [Bradyrhizobium sp.]|nr:type II toxin-antitoxin system ParD family antitoxin [Bradyrhizobium sp.]